MLPLEEGQRSGQEKTSEHAELLKHKGNGILENAYYRILLDEKTGQIWEIYDKTKGHMVLEGRQGNGAVYYQYDRYGIKDLTKYLRKAARRYSDWGILDNGKDSYPECAHITAVPE